MTKVRWLLCAACALLAAGASARADLPPLIPRAVLFADPDRNSPFLSPDGKRLAYLAPDQGVVNIWVRTRGKTDDLPVTRDRGRGIQDYVWSPDGRHILYLRDRLGDENYHLYSMDLRTLEERDLTPFPEVRAQIVKVEPKIPKRILIALNDRRPDLHDVYSMELPGGRLTPVVRNDDGFVEWGVDHELRVLTAEKILPEGGRVLFVRDTPESPWVKYAEWNSEEMPGTGFLAFTRDDRGLYLLSSSGSDTIQLRESDRASKKEKVLAEDSEVDVRYVMFDPIKRTPQAVRLVKDRYEWKILDPAVADDFAAIRALHRGNFWIESRDAADRIWIVGFDTDDAPWHYYTYDRRTRKGEFLFADNDALESVVLARMEPIQFTSRDGLVLHGYLTVPQGLPPSRLPTALLVHGGPSDERDEWGNNEEVQWLANRGYAVLQVNFRGSSGYGKKFSAGAIHEWGGKMQDDLVDGVNWAIARGVADPKRIAIFGGSYGGYAVLAGLAFTPDLFACGVDRFGPSNLITFLENTPPYWRPYEGYLRTRLGDPMKDAEFLKSRSPFFSADRIEKPLLILQGANDPRVKKSESLQMVEALRKAGREVEYVEYADEGHGFARPANRLDFRARAEKFLADHLGGRYEP